MIRRAQTFLEYILVLSVVTAIVLAMSTVFKRSVQGMVKAVADQIGNQVNAEQSGSEDGYLKGMNLEATRKQDIRVTDYLGNISYIYETDFTRSDKYTIVNGGWTENTL